MAKALPTAKEIGTYLSYDSETGSFTRIALFGTGSRSRIGPLAGTRQSAGYLAISVLGRRFLAHRIAWLLSYGAWPRGELDHIDGDRQNNSLSNLREASSSQNKQNQRRRKNATGFRGVHATRGRYSAILTKNSRARYLGTFDCKEEAALAYDKAAAVAFGEFARLNFPAALEANNG